MDFNIEPHWESYAKIQNCDFQEIIWSSFGACKISMTYIPCHSSKRKFLNLRVGWGSRIECIGVKNPNISKHQVGLTSTIVLWGWCIFSKMKIGHKEIDFFFVSRWKHTTPPKNCSHKHRNYAFGFFLYMWTSYLGLFLFISKLVH